MRDAKEVLEQCKNYGFTYDQLEQQLLYNAATYIKGVEGIVCEIGLRDCGGMGVMMVGCLDNNDTDHNFIAIDPYGGISYMWQENVRVFTDYTNKMKNKALKNLYNFCESNNLNFNLYCMEDTEFFKRFEDGVPTYKNKEKVIENKYALVHFDGPHTVYDIIKEVDFFSNKMSVGGMLVFDDAYVGYYDHDKVESFVLQSGNYELVGKETHKASYRRYK
jgi:hypothetical protein